MMTPRLLTLGGETRSMKAWSRYLQIPYKRIESRLRRGLSDEEALRLVNGHDARRRRVRYIRSLVRAGVPTRKICEELDVTRHTVTYCRQLEAKLKGSRR